jgi:signal peptidase I
VKIKNPWLAALLNICISGLGHLYVGRARRGFCVLSLMFSFYIVLGLSGVLSDFKGFALCLIGLFCFQLFLVVDAFKIARQAKKSELRWYMKGRYYLAYAFVFFVLIGFLAQFRGQYLGYEAFLLPSNSMAPLLIKGDYVLVDTKYYINHEIRLDDVVVVDAEAKKYVRRIKGVNSHTVDVAPDNQIAGKSTDSIPLQNIEGKVTYVFFSSHLDRIGLKINSLEGGNQ